MSENAALTSGAFARRGTGPEARAQQLVDALDIRGNGQRAMSETNDLLRALVAITGRIAFPDERLGTLISPTSNPAYLRAYCMCDGYTTIASIAREAGLDRHNLNKAAIKWVELGIAFRLGPKKHLLHLYAVTASAPKRANTTKVGEDAGAGQHSRRRGAARTKATVAMDPGNISSALRSDLPAPQQLAPDEVSG